MSVFNNSNFYFLLAINVQWFCWIWWSGICYWKLGMLSLLVKSFWKDSFYNISCCQLASCYMAFSYGRLQALWTKCKRASYYKLAFAHLKHAFTVSNTCKTDKLHLQKRTCCCFVCTSSPACWVSCMDCWKKRCFKHIFWIAFNNCIYSLC